jgi:hypothetical protein
MWRGRRWCGKNTVWGKTITPTCSGKFIEYQYTAWSKMVGWSDKMGSFGD